jgi:hypothetical protein
MRIFVSYSFRKETKWVDDFVIPLIQCFGHEPVTGRILDGAAIPEEVRALILSSTRVFCFVTRGEPKYNKTGDVVSYDPPDWVRDELMQARGAARLAIEFRENGVEYGGAAPFSAWHPFDSAELPALLLRVAQLLNKWPVVPLQLRLIVPENLQRTFDNYVAAGELRAKCTARDRDDNEGLKISRLCASAMVTSSFCFGLSGIRTSR